LCDTATKRDQLETGHDRTAAMQELDWMIRERDTRAVRITSAGRTGLYETFGLDLNQLQTA
jgi:hypothetical protein